MRNTFKIASVATALFALSATTVMAAEQSQDLDVSSNSDVEVRCEFGAYGQGTCDVDASSEASASGNQRQVLGATRVVYRSDGTAIRVHDVVDTGLDTQGLMAVASTLVTGSAVAIRKIKNRVQ
ncbi:MAG: hypothetical protein ABFQ62_01580 [Patescibacteria group bacterium]